MMIVVGAKMPNQLTVRPRLTSARKNIIESRLQILRMFKNGCMKTEPDLQKGRFGLIGEFAQCRWANFYMRAALISRSKFVTCQVTNFAQCRWANYQMGRPRFIKRPHSLYPRRREASQPRQFNLKPLRKRMNCARAPFGRARLLRDVTADEEVKLEGFDIRYLSRPCTSLQNRQLDVADSRNKVSRNKLRLHSFTPNVRKAASSRVAFSALPRKCSRHAQRISSRRSSLTFFSFLATQCPHDSIFSKNRLLL